MEKKTKNNLNLVGEIGDANDDPNAFSGKKH